ncbi:MAG TPA: hypothetical protein VKP61_09810 [Candidatus Acidoferrum sp.]|nr:hypothetical protein [Candidatus Acidoferrum sp.]
MKRYMWAIVVATSILGWGLLMAQSNPPKPLAEFPGASLKWVHAAEPEFQLKKLDLDNYMISVVEDSDSVTVALTASDSVKGARGSTRSHPGFVVEISKKDLKVIRSNYIR